MIDIHCHILPEVDDGAKDWDTGVQMCQMAHQDGIEHVVATPHANDEYAYNREAHEERLQRLREACGNVIQLSLGCDFHLSFENIQDLLKHPERYCIGNTKYLLVEFSDFALPPSCEDLFATLTGAGLRPIITHPERNPILQRKQWQVVQWASEGLTIQVTANSLTGRWGETARRMADFLYQHGALHVIATDAHSVRDRKPVLSQAFEAVASAVGRSVAHALVHDNPLAIISNEPLPHRPRVTSAARRFDSGVRR
jgi:protein-tyrosine phosphatase